MHRIWVSKKQVLLHDPSSAIPGKALNELLGRIQFHILQHVLLKLLRVLQQLISAPCHLPELY